MPIIRVNVVHNGVVDLCGITADPEGDVKVQTTETRGGCNDGAYTQSDYKMNVDGDTAVVTYKARATVTGKKNER
jgi:hypothetical protein